MDYDEYEDYDAVHAMEEPESYCLLCKKRPIWLHQMRHLKLGKRAICSNCACIHKLIDGKMTVIGFRA